MLTTMVLFQSCQCCRK